ncbi:hypothetical protein LINPERPRIM_LOCUS16104 [Linum perenne]
MDYSSGEEVEQLQASVIGLAGQDEEVDQQQASVIGLAGQGEEVDQHFGPHEPTNDLGHEDQPEGILHGSESLSEDASEYRKSEDSDHVRGNISEDEAIEDIYDGAPRYDPDCDHMTLKFTLGMKFASPSQFKHAVVKHAIYQGANLKWIRGGENRREAVCRAKNCKWSIYGAWYAVNKSFMLKRLGEPHCCARSQTNNQATTRFIARDFLERFRINPDWEVNQIVAEVRLRYGIEVSNRHCYRAKVAAQDMINSTVKEEYKNLRRYLAELKRADPAGRFLLEVDLMPGEESVYFKRFFVGFSSLRKGFLCGCRKMFGLDGCFLKGEVEGMLLAAVGKDGNNQVYPIAWAVVEGENTSSWTWFIQTLKEELGIEDGRGWSVISDQQKVYFIDLNLNIYSYT